MALKKIADVNVPRAEEAAINQDARLERAKRQIAVNRLLNEERCVEEHNAAMLKHALWVASLSEAGLVIYHQAAADLEAAVK